MNRRDKAVALAAASVATLALIGGSLAQFTDSDTTASQMLVAGEVDVVIEEDTNWAENLSMLAIGDTASRSFNFRNSGNLPVEGLVLLASSTIASGPLGGLFNEAVRVRISTGGTELASSTILGLNNPIPIPLSDPLAPGESIRVTFDYEVIGAPAGEAGDRTRGERTSSSNPDNKYQGAGFNVEYNILAVQRAGQGHPTAATPPGGDSGGTTPGFVTETLRPTGPFTFELIDSSGDILPAAGSHLVGGNQALADEDDATYVTVVGDDPNLSGSDSEFAKSPLSPRTMSNSVYDITVEVEVEHTHTPVSNMMIVHLPTTSYSGVMLSPVSPTTYRVSTREMYVDAYGASEQIYMDDFVTPTLAGIDAGNPMTLTAGADAGAGVQQIAKIKEVKIIITMHE